MPKKIERRRFVRLLATGGAALLAAPLAQAAPATSRRRPAARLPGRRAPDAAVRAEIANQKRSLADALRVIRAFTLPPGSPPAFVFRPLRARKGR